MADRTLEEILNPKESGDVEHDRAFLREQRQKVRDQIRTLTHELAFWETEAEGQPDDQAADDGVKALLKSTELAKWVGRLNEIERQLEALPAKGPSATSRRQKAGL